MRLRLGTRGSRLALAQAGSVASALEDLGHGTELVPMTTAGDRGASPRDSAGVKGLFVAEITEALARGEVDLAVHSAKDLPSWDPPGVEVAAVPKRGDPRDVLVTRAPRLPEGGVVGTASLRRRAQLLRGRPGLSVVDVRGNVDTRLRRVVEGRLDGLVLAAAGLARLGIQPEHAEVLSVEGMVPAPGQGALVVQARAGDPAAEAVRSLDDVDARRAFEAERSVVSLLGGGCRLPLGAYGLSSDGRVSLVAVALAPDGSRVARAEAESSTPEEAAAAAADALASQGAAEILREAAT